MSQKIFNLGAACGVATFKHEGKLWSQIPFADRILIAIWNPGSAWAVDYELGNRNEED